MATSARRKRDLWAQVELLASVAKRNPSKASGQLQRALFNLAELSNAERMTMPKRERLKDILEKCRYNGDAPGTVEFMVREDEDERLFINDEFDMNELAKYIVW